MTFTEAQVPPHAARQQPYIFQTVENYFRSSLCLIKLILWVWSAEHLNIFWQKKIINKWATKLNVLWWKDKKRIIAIMRHQMYSAYIICGRGKNIHLVALDWNPTQMRTISIKNGSFSIFNFQQEEIDAFLITFQMD